MQKCQAVLAGFLLLTALPAGAQSWIPLGGPTGGDVRSLAADPAEPRVLYLGTADGILYRSDDSGQRWHRLSPGFPELGMSLDEIVVSPKGEVWVGYWQVAGSGGGVARSTDGGRSFALLADVAGESVRALALAASNPDVLVAGTLSGVLRSDDRGATWRRISPAGHAGIRNVESVAVDAGNPDVIYAGTWHLSWKTTDGGRNWRPAHSGIIDDSDIFSLTLDHRTPRTLYATACSGIYRSQDAGTAWAKLRGIPSSSRRTRCFAQDREHPERLYAGTTEGLWVSEDDAAGWRLATPKDVVVNEVLVLPGGDVLLGCDGAGVLRSADQGHTWTASNEGFSERFVSRLLFDSQGGRVLAAVAGDRFHAGILEAPRVAGPWTRLAAGLEGREVLSFAVAGSGLLAGTDDGVFLFEGEPEGWRRLPTIVDGLDVHPRAVDVAAAGGVLLAATSQGLLRSADRGETWRRASLGPARAITAVAASPRDPRVALAATPLGLYRTDDAGLTWTAAAVGFAEAEIRGLYVLPGDDRVLFATTPHGLYKSVDQGWTWYRRGGGLPLSDITGLALHPDGRTLYASDFTLGGIYKSDDAGDTWARFTTDGLLTDRVWAVAVDPSAPARVLAATPAGGLHVLAAPASAQAAAAP